MADEEPPEREVKDFQFHLAAKIRLQPSTDKVPGDRSSILAVSNKYGLIFAGIDKGFKVLKSSEITGLSVESVTKTVVEDFTDWTTVPTSGTPSHLVLSSDNLTLGVCVKKNNFVFVELYDVRSFAAAKATPSPFMEVKATSDPAADLADIAWNPGADFAALLAVCLTDGGVVLYELKDSINILASVTKGMDAKCLCWSPKGKQLVVGKSNGTFAQYDQALNKKKEFVCPGLFDGKPMTTVDILWESTHVFLVAYEPQDNSDREQPSVVMTTSSKEGTTIYTKFEDPCFGGGEERLHKVYMNHLPEWDLIIVASANALEAGVLGRQLQNKNAWERWNLDDTARAELPLGEEYTETYPMGLVMDRTSQQPIPLGDNKTHPASPMLLMLSTDGVLICFHMMNSNPNVKSAITAAAQTINTAGERKGVPRTPVKDTAAQPQAGGTPVARSLFQSVPSASQPTASQGLGASSQPVSLSAGSAPVKSSLLSNLMGKGTGNQSLNLGQPLSQSTPHPSTLAKTQKPPVTQTPPPSQPVFGADTTKAAPVPATTTTASGKQPFTGFGQALGSGLQIGSSASSGGNATTAGSKPAFSFGSLANQGTTKPPGQFSLSTSGATQGFLSGGAQVASSLSGLSVPTTKTTAKAPSQQPQQQQTQQQQQQQPSGATLQVTKPTQVSQDAASKRLPALGGGQLSGIATKPTHNLAAFSLSKSAAGSTSQEQAFTKPIQVSADSERKPPQYQSRPVDVQPSPTPAESERNPPQYQGRQVEIASHKPQVVPQDPANPRSVGSRLVEQVTEPQAEEPTTTEDPFAKAITEEIAKFQTELAELRDKSSSVSIDIGTKEELHGLRRDTEEMKGFLKGIKETTKSINAEIHDLKGRCLEGFATLEECRLREERSRGGNKRQPYNRGLDPISERQMKEVHSCYQYVDTIINDIDRKLDSQWEAYQNSKNKRMEAPITDTIFHTLSANQKIISQHNRIIDKLCSQLQQTRTYNMQSQWDDGGSRNVSFGGSPQQSIESRRSTAESNDSSHVDINHIRSPVFSPEKRSKLCDFLGSRKVTPIKSKSYVGDRSPMMQSGTSILRKNRQSSSGSLESSPQAFGTTPTSSLPQKAAEATNFWGGQSFGASPNLKPSRSRSSKKGQKPVASPEPSYPQLGSGQKPLAAPAESGYQAHSTMSEQDAMASLVMSHPLVGSALASAMFGSEETAESSELAGYGGANMMLGRVQGQVAPVLGAVTPPGSPPKNVTSQGTPSTKKIGSTSPNVINRGAASPAPPSFGGASVSSSAQSPPGYNFGKKSSSSNGVMSGFKFGGGSSLSNVTFGATSPAPKSAGFSFTAGGESAAPSSQRNDVSSEAKQPSDGAEQKVPAGSGAFGQSTVFAGKKVAMTKTSSSSSITQVDTASIGSAPKPISVISKPQPSPTANLPARNSSDSTQAKEGSKSAAVTTGFSFAPQETSKLSGPVQATDGKDEGSKPAAFNTGFSFTAPETSKPSLSTAQSGFSFEQPNKSSSNNAGSFSFAAPADKPVTTTAASVFGGMSLPGASSNPIFTNLGSSSTAVQPTDPTSKGPQAAADSTTSAKDSAVKPAKDQTVITSQVPKPTTKPVQASADSVSSTTKPTDTEKKPQTAKDLSSAGSADSPGQPAGIGVSDASSGAGQSSVSTTPLFGGSSAASTPSIFGGQTAATSSSTPSVFAAAATTSSIFGGAATSATPGTGIFGQTAVTSASATPSLFGGAAGVTTAASIFGQPSGATTATTGAFGQQPAVTSATGSAFGQSGVTSATTTASVFGQPSTTAASVFGQSSTTSASLFGGTATAATTASIFGQSSTASTTTAASIFGGTTTTASLFGGSAPATTAASIFGGNSSTAAPSAFGQQSSTTSASTPSIFGQPAATTTGTTSIFGQPAATTAAGTASTTSIFGQSGASSTTGSAFGSTTGGFSGFGGQPAGGTVFGGSSASSGNNLFGSQTSKPAAFGQTPATQTTTPTPSPAPGGSGGIFGGDSGGGGLFGGLGGKPSAENANKNVFGSTTTFGSTNQQHASIFGGQSSGGFGSSATSAASAGSGSFSSGAGNITSTGFGGFQSPQAASKPASGFGGAPSFGSPPAFGGAPAFGGQGTSFGSGATFSSPFGGGSSALGGGSTGGTVFGGGSAAATPQQSGGFSGFAQAGSPTFGALAQNTGFGGQPAAFEQKPQSPGGASFTSYRS